MLTRGRLKDAVTPRRSMVTFIVAPFIHCPAVHAQHAREGAAIARQCMRSMHERGLRLPACSTSGLVRHFCAQAARFRTRAANSAVSRSWTSQPTILRLKMSTMRQS